MKPFRDIPIGKTAVLILLMYCLVSGVQAQTMVQEGNVWTYCEATYCSYDSLSRKTQPRLVELTFSKFFFNGEREMNGRLYKEVWRQTWFLVETHYPRNSYVPQGIEVDKSSEPRYYFGLREEDGKIYGLISELNDLLNIDSVDYKQMQGQPLSPLYTTEGDEYVIYDAGKDSDNRSLPYIGNTWFFVVPPWYVIIDALEHNRFLNLFFLDGQLAYQSPAFISDPFFPEIQPEAHIDLTAIRDIPQSPSQPDAQSSSYYDLQGRRLSAPPARGMYIQDKRVKIRE